jgi:PAS domain S-box-containing protein
MGLENKTYEDLTKELSELRQQYDFIQAAYDKEIVGAKEKESYLKSSESRYRTLIDLAVDGILLGSHEGIITDANESMCSIVGIPKSDLVGKHISQVPFTAESLAKSPFRFDLLQKGEIVINDRVIMRPDQTEVTVEMRTKMMPDGTYQSIYRDITERKHSEDELRKSEKKFSSLNTMFRLLVDNTKDLFWAKDVNNKYIFTNTDEPIGKMDIFFATRQRELHPENPEWHTFGEICANTDTIVLNEKIAKQFDEYGNVQGKFLFLDVNKAPIWDEHGNLVGVVGTGRDVTHIKSLEKEKEVAIDSLKKSEERFRLLIENAGDAIFIVKDGVFIDCNLNTLESFGCKRSQIIGQTPYVFSPKYQPDGELSELKALNYIGLATQGIPQRFEWQHCRLDKTTFDTEISLNRLEIKDEILLLAIVRDISQRKHAEQELIKAKEKAEESDRLKTAFLQNMSHEIRTPMNAIMGFSELIVEYYNDKPKLERFSEIINQRSNDLLDIINDILDIAKIESMQLPINIEECNLNELFGELTSFFEEYQVRSNKKQIEFSLQALRNPDENNIATDKVKLKQIFINLISNAFKFTDSGSIVGGCRFDSEHHLIFYVTDTGIGIPPEMQHTVFERFAQLNPGENKLVSGTGLGLSIVKGLVTLLGGEISLESEVGKGTTFSFSIPYKKTQPIELKPLTVEKGEGYHYSDKTILIVEDDSPNAEYLKEILTSVGFNIVHTEYGSEALKIVLSSNVDLILMDIRLPDMDGYQTTRQIRKIKPDLKIIAQTAYASHQEKQKALDSGCNNYISKPIKKDLLIAMINSLLKKVNRC